jgi:VanZ family protein
MSRLLAAATSRALRIPTSLRWCAVFAWAAWIFLLSNQPGLVVSADPGVDGPARHLAHVATYAVLTLLIAWALTRHGWPTARLAIVSALVALLYGVTDEWHQTFVPTRHGQAVDLIWDGLGALITAMAIVAARRSTALDRIPDRHPSVGRATSFVEPAPGPLSGRQAGLGPGRIDATVPDDLDDGARAVPTDDRDPEHGTGTERHLAPRATTGDPEGIER